MSDDYLIHYGVLGMKWGVHRAAKKGTSYSYKSMGTKHSEKRLKRLRQKAKDPKNTSGKKAAKLKSKISSERRILTDRRKEDKALESYARKTSVGKAVAQQILTGGQGKTYAKLRSRGYGRGVSYVNSTLKGEIAEAYLTGTTKKTKKKK